MRLSVIKSLLADRRVPRIELAFSGFNMAEYGVWVSVLVYAYGRGGTIETAAVAVAQLLPAGLLAPVLSRAVDARGAAVSLRRGYWWQAASLGATAALLLTGAPAAFVYAAAIVAASAVTVTRPAQAALLPQLAPRSEQLTAINVLSGWVESVSFLVGPALAGALIAFDGPGAAVGCFALITTVSALLVTGLGSDERRARLAGESNPGPSEEVAQHGWRSGLAALRHDRDVSAVVMLLGAQYFVLGALDVLMVALAIGTLGLGAPGAGYLEAAFGAGGVIGSITALYLIGRRRLAGPLLAAAFGWAVLLVALGSWPTVIGAFLLLGAAGLTRSVLDVSGRTMLLRAVPAGMRGRVFGVLEGTAMFGLALGSLLVPALAELGGAGTGLVATGLLLGAIGLFTAARLHRVDEASAPHDPAPAPATAYALTI